MIRTLCATMSAVAMLAALSSTASAQKLSSTPIKDCSLLPKEEVKKHLPWDASLDKMPL